MSLLINFKNFCIDYFGLSRYIPSHSEGRTFCFSLCYFIFLHFFLTLFNRLNIYPVQYLTVAVIMDIFVSLLMTGYNEVN